MRSPATSVSRGANPPLSSIVTPQQLKKALIAQGFEVYRTTADGVVLAERPRENLILDSGVRVLVSEATGLRVELVVRAQRAHFPQESEEGLYGKARALAESLVGAGFEEARTSRSHATDPADGTRVLDTFYEVTFGRTIDSLESGAVLIREALSLEKNAGGSDHSG